MVRKIGKLTLSYQNKIKGWHVGPYYQNIHFSQGEYLSWEEPFFKTNINILGVTSGYQWIFKSNITFELVFGLGAGVAKVDHNYYWGLPDREVYTFVLPNGGFSFGYNF